MEKRIKFLSTQRKALIISAINAIFVLTLCYYIDNLPYSFTGGASLGQRIEQLKAVLGFSADVIPEDVIIINVAYDRELVTVNDEFGLPKGNRNPCRILRGRLHQA